MYKVDWLKLSVWTFMLLFCFGFWFGLFYMQWINQFLAFLIFVGAGIFAWESTMIVDEQKRARRRNEK